MRISTISLKWCLLLLSLFFLYHCDTASTGESYAAQKKELANKVEELFNKDVDSALYHLSRLTKLAVKEKDTALWVQTKLTLVSHYFNSGNWIALDSFTKVIEKTGRSPIFGQDARTAIINFNRSYMDCLEGDYDGATKRIDTLESLISVINSPKYEFAVLFLKGNVFRAKDNTNKALKAYQRVVEISEKNGFGVKSTGIIHYSIASIYYDVEEHEKAIGSLEKVYHLLHREPFFRLHCNINLAANYIHLQNFECAKSYLELVEWDAPFENLRNKSQYLMLRGFYEYEQGHYEKSIDFYGETYKLLMENKNIDASSLPYASINLSNAYLKLKKYDLAKKYAKITEESSVDLRNVYRLIDAYINQSQIDSLRKNYKSALHYFQQAAKLKDSMNAVNNKEKLATVELEFAEEKKDNEIASLKLGNSEQKLAAEKNKTSRAIILFLLLGTIGFSTVLYYRYRTKAKMNKLLQEKELILNNALGEKELLLKEIHHRVKNNLQLIISLLAIQGLSQEKEDKVVKAFLEKGESRIKSMALIHQILYETEGVEHVNFKNYIRKLIEAIKESYPSNKGQISYQLH
ncbi:MAG: histidine kinase dimerization/phosphoacceptor domain -containing protein, partial [Bacteroidota bacterium]